MGPFEDGVAPAHLIDLEVVAVSMVLATLLVFLKQRNGRSATRKLWLQDTLSISTVILLALVLVQYVVGHERAHYDVMSANVPIIVIMFGYVIVEIAGTTWDGVQRIA